VVDDELVKDLTCEELVAENIIPGSVPPALFFQSRDGCNNPDTLCYEIQQAWLASLSDVYPSAPSTYSTTWTSQGEPLSIADSFTAANGFLCSPTAGCPTTTNTTVDVAMNQPENLGKTASAQFTVPVTGGNSVKLLLEDGGLYTALEKTGTPLQMLFWAIGTRFQPVYTPVDPVQNQIATGQASMLGVIPSQALITLADGGTESLVSAISPIVSSSGGCTMSDGGTVQHHVAYLFANYAISVLYGIPDVNGNRPSASISGSAPVSLDVAETVAQWAAQDAMFQAGTSVCPICAPGSQVDTSQCYRYALHQFLTFAAPLGAKVAALDSTQLANVNAVAYDLAQSGTGVPTPPVNADYTLIYTPSCGILGESPIGGTPAGWALNAPDWLVSGGGSISGVEGFGLSHSDYDGGGGDAGQAVYVVQSTDTTPLSIPVRLFMVDPGPCMACPRARVQ
jgi:hypothetical protein